MEDMALAKVMFLIRNDLSLGLVWGKERRNTVPVFFLIKILKAWPSYFQSGKSHTLRFNTSDIPSMEF